MKKKTFIQLFIILILPILLIGQNFTPVWTSPYNPMTVYTVGAVINGTNLQAGDEIGIFDTDPNTNQQICVGAGTLVQPLIGGAYLEIIASMNDGSIPGHANGFTPGHIMIFKYYSPASGLVENVEASFPYPGYDEKFASQGNAFVTLSAILEGQYLIATTVNPVQGGTTTGSGSYSEGDEATVTATPNDCWFFVNWTENGTIVSTNEEYSFVVTGDRNLTANFEQIQYQIGTTSNPTSGGTTSGNGTYLCGLPATVTAIPEDGFSFVNWTENSTEVSTLTSYTFTVESDRNLIANFQIEVNYFEPVWTSPYNPMTIYVLEALLDDINLQPESQVGVFDLDPNNGEEICVGALILNSIVTPANYIEIIASMNDGSVPGHANGFTPGHSFIFKYMTNTGQLVEQVACTFPYPGYNEVFTSQGSAIVELSATGILPINHEILLSSGWTGISSYLIPVNTEIQNVLASIDGELIIIQNLDEFYQPGNAAGLLQNWNYQSGYFIKTTGGTTLTISGTIPLNKTISLSTGWNLIPVLSVCEVSVNSLFIDQIENVEFIKEAVGIALYWPSKNITSLTQLIPGHSYLVKVTQNIQVTFPACE